MSTRLCKHKSKENILAKKTGRPKVYENEQGKRGAPTLAVRLSPEVHQHIVTRDEGPRAYVERLVTDDIERTKATGEA